MRDLRFRSVTLFWESSFSHPFPIIAACCMFLPHPKEKTCLNAQAMCRVDQVLQLLPNKNRLFATRPSTYRMQIPLLGRSRAAGRCIERGDMIAEAASCKCHGNPRTKSCNLVVSMSFRKKKEVLDNLES